MRQLPTDDKYSLRGDVLARAIQKDKAKGLLPFFVSIRDIEEIYKCVNNVYF